ncbi:branched-chain amino acid ABC transporter permease [Roseovarius sp. TE539]|uniref:branched-chain amino acid ABC transporter permease n=1 Tax=Roseovarius sp. TE539 TaxID=2249812 RepID=UPI000DE0BBD6|nr:branched-chain amino acid ABC transporter permease [Roseovarius sp. TE539]RBI68390.1 branched-chain amino acid ABC transporter permease [Roseovarius sp. TE539]
MKSKRRGLYATVAAWVALGILGLLFDGWLLSQMAIYFCYGMFAMGLSLIWGQAGILSFGQAIFFGAGAYGFALVTLNKIPGLGVSVAMGFVVAIVLATALAAVIASLTFAARGLSGAHFAIVTLCAAVVVETATTRSDYLGGYNGLFGIPPLSWNGTMIGDHALYYLMLSITLLAFLSVVAIIRSPYGTLLEAIRDNEHRVRHLGYVPHHLKSAAFILAGALSGLAGALFAAQFGFVSPSLLGFALSTQVLVWVAVGGRAVPMAAMLGALVVPGAENMLSNVLGDVWLLVIGVLFVAVVVAARGGVFGNLLRLPLPQRLRE